MAALIHENSSPAASRWSSAGTHGKTTTTSMLAWIYEVAGRTNPGFAPSFLIGGVAENFGTSFQVNPTSRTFILEGDEYDTAFFDKGPKFLHYFPDAAILTHVEFDHADIYADLDAVKTAFKRLVNLIPRRGRLVALRRQRKRHRMHAPKHSAPSSATASARFLLASRQPAGTRADTHWTLLRGGERFAELPLPMAGEHNALNATAAAALAAGQGCRSQPSRGASNLPPVKRRLEVRAGSTASPSSTTSPTTPLPSAKPCAPCAPPTPAAASGPSSNPVPTPSAAMSSRAN